MITQQYFKIIGYNKGTYPYRVGMNTLKHNGEKFNPSPECTKRGLYFTDASHIKKYLDYGDKICWVELPPTATVVEVTDKNGKKWKADKINISRIENMSDIEVCKELVEKNIIDKDDYLRWTYSWNSDHRPIIQYLLNIGADVHAKNKYESIMHNVYYYFPHNIRYHEKNEKAHAYNHVLREASKHGNLAAVQFVVENGADVHSQDDYALRWASVYGHLSVVQYLVENGANVHSQDDYALRRASQRDHHDVVKYLVENGADAHILNPFYAKTFLKIG